MILFPEQSMIGGILRRIWLLIFFPISKYQSVYVEESFFLQPGLKCIWNFEKHDFSTKRSLRCCSSINRFRSLINLSRSAIIKVFLFFENSTIFPLSFWIRFWIMGTGSHNIDVGLFLEDFWFWIIIICMNIYT